MSAKARLAAYWQRNACFTVPMGHLPGTLYPLNGPAHLPTMCGHRTGVRRNFRSHTVLCYAHGDYEVVNQDTGVRAHIETAEGKIQQRYCSKHIQSRMDSYAKPNRLVALKVGA